MPRFGYTPTEADQVKQGIEDHVRLASHHLERLRAKIPGAGSIPSRLDGIEEQVKGVADDLCDLVDQRTEAGARF